MEGLQLAPAIVVRVAAWPMAAVTGLGAEEVPDPAEGEAFEQAHARALEHDRAHLWARTVEDPRFMRALAVANPELARGLVGRTRPSSRNKKVRHLETTLYRYLARAVSRTQPGDLWAGATLAGWGPRRRTEAHDRARCLVAPDLAPFRALMQALADRAPYPERSPYKLNPTLARQDDGAWLWWSAPGREASRQRRLAGSASVDAILETLATARTWTRPEATRAVAAQLGRALPTVRRTIDTLCDRGVLVGGLAFPRHFADPWQALDRAERLLAPEHAEPWRRARLRLAELAAGLAAVLHECDAPTVVAAMDAAGAVLEDLGAALDVESLARPRAALRCDVEAPWRIELGPGDARAIEHALLGFLRHQDAEGLYEVLLRAASDRALERPDTRGIDAITTTAATVGGATTWAAVLADQAPSPAARERGEQQQAYLDDPGADAWLTASGRVRGPSLAAVHLSMLDPALGGGLAIHGLGVDPTAAYARLAPLLDSGAGRTLEGWLRGCHQRLRTHAGVEPVALLYDHDTPNVLAQPDLWGGVLDPWGVTEGQLPDRGLRLALDPEGQRLVVWADALPRPLLVHAPTAASPRCDDPCVHALLLSSMHVPPLTRPDVAIVHGCELESSRHRARLRLPDGTVTQPRRTVVPRAELEPLLKVRGAARFAAWQRLARRHGWPRLLRLEHGGRLPLLVHRDSPLAVEAAFEGGARMQLLVVEEHVG
ncbi:MAG: hypothetical protein KDK70_33620, partial [Myxococcales bacterium]|nr:hypothetical protein [Myxococcales bacterium]